MKKNIVGIDLGTTHSLISINLDGQVYLIPDREGRVLTPSVVSVTENNEILVGHVAKERLITHKDRSASVFKRKMGTDYMFQLGRQRFYAFELSSLILKKLKNDAEYYLKQEVTEAIISVPAYFNNLQRQDTIKAARLAGFHVLQLVNEPTAAALAYGVQHLGDTTFFVFDLGGGTFDVTLLEVYKDLFEVRAMSGDSSLGGEDFTRVIYEYLKSFIEQKKYVLNIEEDIKLWKEAEILKKNIDYGYDSLQIEFRGETLLIPFTQDLFYNLAQPLFEKMIVPIQRTLIDTNYMAVDRVILVGGASRMGIFQRFIRELFVENANAHSLLDVTLNPDEAIGIGIGHVLGIIQGEKTHQHMILSDVSPFSLGTEIIGDRFSPIIERNTHLPISMSKQYYTVNDNQEQVAFSILQGENAKASYNVEIGSFTMNVPRNKAGEESITLKYTYDISGVLAVLGTVNSTGETKQLIYGIDGNTDVDFEKIHLYSFLPIEQEENYSMLSKALQFSEQITGEEKEELTDMIHQFNKDLNGSSQIAIVRSRDKLCKFMDLHQRGTKIYFKQSESSQLED